MNDFSLHPRLLADTMPIGSMGLNRLLLMNDCRFPWIIMVPQRFGLTEIHELTPLDQTMMTFEITEVSRTLKTVTGCDKINVGALGNLVPQLHIHVVARSKADAAWPGPVWGSGAPEPWKLSEARRFIDGFAAAL